MGRLETCLRKWQTQREARQLNTQPASAEGKGLSESCPWVLLLDIHCKDLPAICTLTALASLCYPLQAESWIDTAAAELNKLSMLQLPVREHAQIQLPFTFLRRRWSFPISPKSLSFQNPQTQEACSEIAEPMGAVSGHYGSQRKRRMPVRNGIANGPFISHETSLQMRLTKTVTLDFQKGLC